MKRSIRLAVLALVAIGVLAFARKRLRGVHDPDAEGGPGRSEDDDRGHASRRPTMRPYRASIYVPIGTPITTLNQAPGTTLGTVKAQVVALALGGALLPLTGEIKVAPPGAVTAASQTACIQAATPAATWLMVLQAAGQTLNVPMYVVTTAGAETAFGPAKIVRLPRRRRTCRSTRAAPRSERSCSRPSSR